MVDDGGRDGAAEVADAQPKAEWPTHFPPGCPCPKCMPECRDVNERVYHIVRVPRKAIDSLSHHERDLSHDSPPCQRAGLSVYLNLDDLRQVQKTMGHWKNRHIAAADLRPEHGRIAPTENRTHFTLWLRRSHLSAHDALFSEVVE